MKNITRTSKTVALLIVGLGLAVNGYSQSFLTNGLIAYYPFNGNANDSSVNVNNGLALSAVLTTDRFGVSGHAYQFNGVNADIVAANQSYLSFPNSGDFTISVWVALSSLPTSVTFFIGMDNGAFDTPKWILAYGQLALPAPPGFSANYVHFITTGVNGAPQSYFLASTLYTPALGSWHQYVVSKGGTDYTLYIDGLKASGATNYMNDNGVLRVGVTGPSAIPSGITAPLTIGSAENGGWLNGKLDDIRIYNRAFSVTEVQQLYAYEYGAHVNLLKAVKPSFDGLALGTNYQLQVSTDLKTWTNNGSPFTPTNTVMDYPQYFDVDNWNSLYFRLHTSP
jgi:hypothetical protein